MPLCLTETFGGGEGFGTGGVETSHRCRLERSSGGSTWGRDFGALGLALGLEMLGLRLAGGETSIGAAGVASDTLISGSCKVFELEGSRLEGSTGGLALARGGKNG